MDWDLVWAWTWPSLVLVGCLLVVVLGARWLRRRFEDHRAKKLVIVAAGTAVALEAALWFTFSPLLAAREARWEIAWAWLWPSLSCFALAVGVVIANRWASERMRTHILPKRGWFSQRTLKRMSVAVVIGGFAGALSLWAIAAPLPQPIDDFVRDSIFPWMWPSLLLVGWLAFGVLIGRQVLVWLAERAERTETELDDILVAALRRPLWLVVLVSGVHLWAGLVPLPERVAEYFDGAMTAATIVVIVVLVDSLAQSWMEARAKSSMVLATTGGVLRTATKVVIYIVGGLMVLSGLGIDITPVIASLGIGSLAIGLALQKTLEDFLAGLFIAADQPVRVGDFVELGSGEAGTVINIGWRTTRIRTRDDMHVVVPNSHVVTSVLINRSLPDAHVAFKVPVGVSYSSDLDRVVVVAREVAEQLTAEDERAVTEFKPRVVFEGFGDSSINFNAWLQAKEWDSHFGLQDAYVRKLHKRFDQEGINIPFPIRTLDVPKGTVFNVGR